MFRMNRSAPISRAAAAIMVLASCGVAMATPTDISGLWTAVSEHQGDVLSLTLKVKGNLVTGSAERRMGTLAARRYTVAGRYQPPVVDLTLTFPGDPPWTLRATLTGPETLQGKWSNSSGFTQELTLVRP